MAQLERIARLFRVLPRRWELGLASRVGLEGIDDPIFILGCGRSGTTILGRALSKHPGIKYLNEPRDIWKLCYPETDIWSPEAVDTGKLVLTEADLRSTSSRRLRSLFSYERLKSGAEVLVEKLPINSFRLGFIQAIFPGARYVYISRGPQEVARSIEKLAQGGGWYGHDGHKWELLREWAAETGRSPRLAGFPRDNYERGLLEWRLGTEAVYSFFANLSPEKFHEVAYDDFVETPMDSVRRIVDFIGLEQSSRLDQFVENTVSRRSQKRLAYEVGERDRLILGGLAGG